MSEEDSLIKRIKEEIIKDGGIIPTQNRVGYNPEVDADIYLIDLDRSLIHGEDYL